MPASGFAITGINHLGIAAKDTAKAQWFFGDILGLLHLGDELVLSQKTMTLMYESANSSAPNSPRLELLKPQDSETDSPISKFLEKKGAGIHHVALTVTNIRQAILHLITSGVRMIDESPRDGAHKTKIAFVHPESTGGILVELVEEQHLHKFGFL